MDLAPSQRLVILVVFLASGAAGLAYQVVWTRELSLVFGVTTYAVSTVLATFMGGLALGSWLFGRWIDRHSNPLFVYGVLEIGIGAYALAVPALFAALEAPYVLLRQLELPYLVLALGRAVLAGLVLILPTTLMGGTFPILVRFFVLAGGGLGRTTGLLYFANTVGALAGCLAAGFWLIAWLGLDGTTSCAAATSIAAGLVAVALGARRRPAPEATARVERVSSNDRPERRSRAAGIALVAIGLSGFASLAYEVVWTRALLRYLYNSTYAFTTMLATFLAGIALGAAFYATVLRDRGRPLLAFAALEFLTGLGFLVSSLLFANLPGMSTAILGREVIQSFGESVLMMFVRAGLILLLPAVFLGATLPLAVEICAHRLDGVGAGVGRVYAVNTLGAILGSLAAAFLLIPALGMQGTLTLLIGLNLLLAWLLAVFSAEGTPRRIVAGAALAFPLAGLLSAVPNDLFRRTFAPAGSTLVYYREGATDTVGVVETNGQRIIQYDDRRGTAGTLTYSFNYFLGHLPLLLHPGEPRRVLHICFGVGNSLSAVTAHESVERVDNVELSPHVLEAARYFWTNADVLSHPKVRTIIDDGRNFLLASRESYDAILLEPPEIFTAGVINLYTREFYQYAAARLEADGLMMQWLPIGEASVGEERMLFRAFSDVFPHATAWRQLPGGPLLLIGTKKPLSIDYQRLRERMKPVRIARDLELAGIVDVDHLLSFFVFDEASFSAFARPAAAVTDDRTVLDFTMPYYLGSGFGLGTFTPHAVQEGRGPLHVASDRTLLYLELSRSVVPLLANLNGEAPQAIEARISAWRPKQTGFRFRPISESAWRRW